MIRRFLQMIVSLWAIATILFLIFRLLPGDPSTAYIDTTFTGEQRAAILHQFGLDQPLWRQYLIYLGDLAHGELGISFRQRAPVLGQVLSVLPNTLVLSLAGLVVAYVFGTIAGALLAARRGTKGEAIAIPIVLASRATPDFWLGMVLLAIFGFGLGWFPSGGAVSAGADFSSNWSRIFSLDYAWHLVLPATALAIYLQGLPLLLMRSNMLEVMQDEFVTMARMKGLSEWTILMRHAARNALLPVVTAFALGVGGTIGSNVVIETVFSWPGLGRMLVDAVASSDYPLAQGAFLVIAVVLVVMNFVADLLYGWLDPRIAHAAG